MISIILILYINYLYICIYICIFVKNQIITTDDDYISTSICIFTNSVIVIMALNTKKFI
jgi:type IV secretory pathway VirB3-like protein